MPLCVRRCPGICLAAATLLLIGSTALHAEALKLTVAEPSGVPRRGWPVTSGVPFKQGALKDHRATSLVLADRRELPLQTEVLASWPDGSVRWLLLDFQVDLAPGQRKTLSLRYGPEVRRSRIRDGVSVSQDKGDVTLTTGPMRVRLSGRAFRLLDAVWLDRSGDGSFADQERLPRAAEAGIVLRTPDGGEFRADKAPAKLTVEQAGPVRACVRIEGSHSGADGAMFGYVARVHAFRGQPFARVFYTFVNNHPDALMAKVDSLNLSISLAGRGRARSVLGGKAGASGRLFQIDERRYEINGRPMDGRGAGWAAMGDEAAGLAVGVREFWQNWPKSIEVSPEARRLSVGLCPAFPKGRYDGKGLQEENKLYYHLRDGVYTFKVGLARSHEMWATFFAGPPDAAKLRRFFQAAEEPLLAACEPAHVDATKALGDLPPADERKYAGYDKAVAEAFRDHLRRREEIREYGMLNYGDWYGERRVNWGNLEYDLAHGMFLQYLRTGERAYFLRGEQAARHHIDVDVVHAVNKHLKNPWGPPPRVGEIWLHCLNHTGGYYHNAPLPVSRTYQMGHSTNFGHVWVAGDVEYYYLTGDRRAREVAVAIADAMAHHCPTRYGNHIRALGWPIILLLAAYELTGDGKYLDAATSCWEVLRKNLDPNRGWVVRLAKGHCYHEDRRCHGNVPFMEGLTCCALARYHRITGSREALRAVTAGLDQMTRECWLEDRKTFRYTACPLSPATWHGLFALSAEAFAHEVAHTGNKEHLRILRDGLREMIRRGFSGNGKALAQVMHFTPHALRCLEK